MAKIIAKFPNSAGHLPFWISDEQGYYAKCVMKHYGRPNLIIADLTCPGG